MLIIYIVDARSKNVKVLLQLRKPLGYIQASRPWITAKITIVK